MEFGRMFKSQTGIRTTYKHHDYPIYISDEFDFFRCVEFQNDFYGRTASKLFNGNLRPCKGRYSCLFPGQKLSYWADSPQTARAEIKHHGAGNDIITFWAYDDASSSFPVFPNPEPLIIIDGRKSGIQDLLEKANNNIALTTAEQNFLQKMLEEKPDCLAYDSHAKKGGENFIFFEKGFRKLLLRKVSLRFGRNHGGNHCNIACAVTGDYMPRLKNYGNYFAPKARVEFDIDYLKTEEYLSRVQSELENRRIYE